MKIVINKTVTEEREIELPMFLNYGNECKIISEEECIYVTNSNYSGASIQQGNKSMVDHFITVGKPSTEAAFNNTYQKALTKLNDLSGVEDKTTELLEDIREYMDSRSDVIDGDNGQPIANKAMEFVMRIDKVLPPVTDDDRNEKYADNVRQDAHAERFEFKD